MLFWLLKSFYANPNQIGNRPVLQAEQYVRYTNVLVIIAVMPERKKEVELYLDTFQRGDNINSVEFI